MSEQPLPGRATVLAMQLVILSDRLHADCVWSPNFSLSVISIGFHRSTLEIGGVTLAPLISSTINGILLISCSDRVHNIWRSVTFYTATFHNHFLQNQFVSCRHCFLYVQ